MQSEQQQRIMGYFIEEARDHLNTIEQGLLNLQSTMEDVDMVNEIFRAAHSVKGGAAMLGLNSIHHTAHRLEDCFKILQESPLTADQQLETLFLQVFDTLQSLLEQLQGPFGLTDETTREIMAEAEPVFEQLNTHLKHLAKIGKSSPVVTTPPLPLAKAPSSPKATKTLPGTFKRDVLIELREMLQLFKQPDCPENRATLQGHCTCLANLGEQFDLPGWSELLETAKAAIAYPDNSYRLLANVTIKDIKQAQELALAGRSVEIAPTEQLKALTPQFSLDSTDSDIELATNNESTILSSKNRVNTSNTHIQEDTYIQQEITYIQGDSHDGLNKPKETSHYSIFSEVSEHGEPEVGMAELNSLADIFEGQTPDIEQTWEQEEIINIDENIWDSDTEHPGMLDEKSDFADLIGDTNNFGISHSGALTSDDFNDWLGNEFEEGDLDSQAFISSQSSQDHPETLSSLTDEDDFADLLFESDNRGSFTTQQSASNELNGLLDNSLFAEEGSLAENTADLEIDSWDFQTGEDYTQFANDNQSDETIGELDLDLNDLLEISNSSNSTTFNESIPHYLQTPSIPDALATSNLEFNEVENLQEDIFEEDLFDDNVAGDGSHNDDISEFFFTEDVEEDSEDVGADLEALFGKETTEEIDPLSLSEESVDEFDWAADFATSESPAENVELPPRVEAETGLFDWEEAEISQEAVEDLDLFFGEETREQVEPLFVLEEPVNEFNVEEDLFLSESPTESATEDDLFDWQETPETVEQADSELESLFEEETSSPTEALAAESGDEFDWEADLAPIASVEEVETEDDLFDWQETPETVEQADSELESLFEEETSSPTEALAAESGDEFDWEADLAPIASVEEVETEDDLFDWEETPETSQIDESELESLFEEEIASPTEALGTESVDEFDWEADLGGSETVTESATEEDLFDWEETPETSQIDESELESLFEEETPSATEALGAESVDEFDWEGDLVGSETLIESATEEDLFDWEETPEISQQTEANLEELLDGAGLGIEEEFSLETPEESDWLSDLEIESDISDEFTDLEAMLESQTITASSELDSLDQFTDLEAMLESETTTGSSELDSLDQFADLEAMLSSITTSSASAALESEEVDDAFDDLEALLSDEQIPTAAVTSSTTKKATKTQDKLDEDLEALLQQAEQTMGGASTTPEQRQSRALPTRRIKMFEQTMRVPVKHLDSLSNLVGELVVSRNSLEGDQERLRQFLDNLQHQVVALSDVGARMRDLYERSLLESSLLASRHNYRSSGFSDGSSQNTNTSGAEYHPLEMDRFTGFHLLSQEMIELIVQVRESASDIEFLVDETDQVARNLRQVTTQLQEGLTRSRMVPFAQNADKLHRAVRDISMKLGKEAELHIEGRETLIDKMILEHLNDPMTHLVNNALTHGIESPEVRKAAKKPRAGQVILRAFHQGNQTVISISDDGAGINPEKVRKKAIEKNLITPAEAKSLTPVDLYDFLFHPGFTTKDKADDFSGRGVGMDVVRTSLSEIRGAIYIDSAIGKGTTFTIRLPLTLSICKALCCLSDHARIAFPMDGVEDMFDVSCDRVQTNSEGQTCIPWRDGVLPFQPLSELLAYNRQISRATIYGGKREDNLISIIVLRSAGNFIALQVDQVLGEQEIVIKQLEGPAPKPVGIAGATVLGDGRIMPIADVLELIDLSMGRIRKDGVGPIWARDEASQQEPPEEATTQHEPMVLIVDDSITVRELLSMTFAKAGYRVEQARDGQEAWEKLRSGLPCDIVFCDIEMPRMDGLELLSRLQKDEKLNHLPIAMLTSRGAKRHRQMASQLGASGYFTKPYLEEMLLDAAQRMMKGEVLLTASED